LIETSVTSPQFLNKRMPDAPAKAGIQLRKGE